MIEYKCSVCGAALETEDSLGGKAEACPGCGSVNPVPLSKEQKRQQKEQEKALQREIAEKQRQEEPSRNVEAERHREAKAAQGQQQYLAAVGQAKSKPETPRKCPNQRKRSVPDGKHAPFPARGRRLRRSPEGSAEDRDAGNSLVETAKAR